jgi:cytosine deaminase
MQARGITVGWGQDCVLDPWYSLGTADMLDVAFMGLRVGAMASLVVLDAGNGVKALRLRADRLAVTSKGKIVATRARNDAPPISAPSDLTDGPGQKRPECRGQNRKRTLRALN